MPERVPLGPGVYLPERKAGLPLAGPSSPGNKTPTLSTPNPSLQRARLVSAPAVHSTPRAHTRNTCRQLGTCFLSIAPVHPPQSTWSFMEDEFKSFPVHPLCSLLGVCVQEQEPPGSGTFRMQSRMRGTPRLHLGPGRASPLLSSPPGTAQALWLNVTEAGLLSGILESWANCSPGPLPSPCICPQSGGLSVGAHSLQAQQSPQQPQARGQGKDSSEGRESDGHLHPRAALQPRLLRGAGRRELRAGGRHSCLWGGRGRVLSFQQIAKLRLLPYLPYLPCLLTRPLPR